MIIFKDAPRTRSNNLALYPSSCGGKDETPTSLEMIILISNASDSTQAHRETHTLRVSDGMVQYKS